MPTDEPRYGGHTAAELLALEKAATPNWKLENCTVYALQPYAGDPLYAPADGMCNLFAGSFSPGHDGKRLTSYDVVQAQARLAVAARNALPELLAEVERLYELMDEHNRETARADAAAFAQVAAMEAEIARLRKALEGVVEAVDLAGWHDEAADNAKQIAREALEGR